MHEVDIWRVAQLMIDQYGDRAELEAARREDELRAKGATTGADELARIIAAIVQLRQQTPGGGHRH